MKAYSIFMMAAASLAAASTLHAEEWQITIAGAPAGTETVTAAPGLLSAEGAISVSGVRMTTRYSMALDAGGRPVSYEAEIGAGGKSAVIKGAVSHGIPLR